MYSCASLLYHLLWQLCRMYWPVSWYFDRGMINFNRSLLSAATPTHSTAYYFFRNVVGVYIPGIWASLIGGTPFFFFFFPLPHFLASWEKLMQRNTLLWKSADAHPHAVQRCCELVLVFAMSCNLEIWKSSLKRIQCGQKSLNVNWGFKGICIQYMSVARGKFFWFVFCLQYLLGEIFFKYML